MLERYVRMARAAGTEVEILSIDELPGRLTSLLLLPPSELSCIAEVPPVESPPSSPGRLAAIPVSGWPERLLQTVKEVVNAAGCDIVSEKEVSGMLAWDRELLDKAFIGITFCPVFLADTGSIVTLSGPGMGTLASLLPEVHIALSCSEGCRKNLGEYLETEGLILPSRLTLITGPSRTGDIECTMTAGVHGPGRVIHFVVRNSPHP